MISEGRRLAVKSAGVFKLLISLGQISSEMEQVEVVVDRRTVGWVYFQAKEG